MTQRRNRQRLAQYFGYLDDEGRARVFRIGAAPLPYELTPRLLPPNLDIGFSWGDSGAAAQHLGLALLADYLQDEAKARRPSRFFTEKVIRNLRPDRHWQLTFEDIASVLNTIAGEAA